MNPLATESAASLQAIPDAPAPGAHFEPASNEALWQLISAPHPLTGSAKHLGEALVNAGIVQAGAVSDALKLQHHERDRGLHRLIGQILVSLGSVTQYQPHQPHQPHRLR